MNKILPIAAALLLAACQPATPPASTDAGDAAAPAAADAMHADPMHAGAGHMAPDAMGHDATGSGMPGSSMAPMRATVRGVVQSVDAAAHTVEIAHEPVAALDWPEMTMTFKAPDVDVSALQPGDEVEFEVTAMGMDGTITAIRKP